MVATSFGVKVVVECSKVPSLKNLRVVQSAGKRLMLRILSSNQLKEIGEV